MVVEQSDASNGRVRRQFFEAGIGFYHADNLNEIQAQLAQKRVMSRQNLCAVPEYRPTEFYSDDDDKGKSAFGRTFGNIRDFGDLFARFRRTVPNVYGPITLEFSPEIYGRMRDVLLTKESVVKYPSRERWRAAAARSEEDVAAIVEQNCRGYLNPETNKFDDPWRNAEVSCAEGELGFEHLKAIVVEPVRVLGVELPDVVAQVAKECGVGTEVRARVYRRHTRHREVLQELVLACERHEVADVQARWQKVPPESLPPEIRGLSTEMVKRIQLWCRYFTYGTLLPMRQRLQPLAAELDADAGLLRTQGYAERRDPGGEPRSRHRRHCVESQASPW